MRGFKQPLLPVSTVVPKESRIPRVRDAMICGASVGIGLAVLSWLDTMPMPWLCEGCRCNFGLPDIKFYCPPHAAVAVILFQENSLPSLTRTLGGLVITVASTVLFVELVDDIVGNVIFLRALAAGIAMGLMSYTGTVFPPAGALSVLFVDNKTLKEGLGRAYIFMPGLSGTLALFALAAAKIKIVNLFKRAS